MINAATRIKLYDLAMASPLIMWLGLGIIGATLRISQTAPEWRSAFAISSQIATIILLGLVIACLIIRRPAIGKAPGATPRLVAIIGLALPSLVALAPRTEASATTMVLSSAITLLGTAAAIYAVVFLGRAFSVFPQARRLSTDGPYRIVRHPLYLAELVVIFGAIWDIQQPWPPIIFACAVAIQTFRMHFEEKILAKTFPSYCDYAKRTARLVPGIY
ncbi:MAG: isoprenylcysteine carboxylmethyltransferase family protein [Methylocystis sp.]